MKKGFTLAEILIILGVIGVVASLTLPSVIKHYQQKALEASFKKSYSNLYNALNMSFIQSDDDLLQGDSFIPDKLIEKVTKQYKYIQRADYTKYTRISSNENVKIKTYTKKILAQMEQCSQGFGFSARNTMFITPDKSVISITRNCGGIIWVTIDTNGSAGKPNALGHDIFLFKISNMGKLNSYYEFCNISSDSKLNGIGCSFYALQNKCPYDDTKTYWECLP